ncbi:MAG: hypothetical protein JNN28_15125 [Saprospiraceae bacterium]|nr:hypothetical protein [Saprospiraceae bacterium]
MFQHHLVFTQAGVGGGEVVAEVDMARVVLNEFFQKENGIIEQVIGRKPAFVLTDETLMDTMTLERKIKNMGAKRFLTSLEK